jgi:hypothetical protein
MNERQEIAVTDFDMSFWRKAGLTIKREVAAIPAALVLIIVWIILTGVVARIILLG